MKFTRTTIVIFAFVLVNAMLTGCSREPNVLLITVDALRADRLGIYGYDRDTSPHLDAFFEKGTVYDRAYCTEANTGPSVASFLSGLLAQEVGVRLLYQKFPRHVDFMPDYLSEAGYQTAGIVSNIVLTSEATELDWHFDYFDDFLDEDVPGTILYERAADATTNAGLTWMVDAWDSSKPYFLWVHYQDTHGPYQAPADKTVTFSHPEPLPIDVERVPPYMRVDTDDGLYYVDRYDEELAYADFHINRLLEAFEREGLLDNTLVIFSADHGESMMEHEEWFTHGYQVYEEIMRVPLLIRYPGQRRGKRVTKRVSLVDLLPTVLKAAGVDIPSRLRGKPLNRSFDEVPVYARGKNWRGMIHNDKKWMIEYRRGTTVPKRRRVYDLIRDPHELHPLPWEATAEAEAFYDLVESDPDPAGIPKMYDRGIAIGAPKVRPGLDEKTLDKLRSLGYVK